MTAKETTSTQINLPSKQIQADRLAWLEQVRRNEQGNPALLLSGLTSTADSERWDIGIAGAWQRESDPSQIVLKLPKPASHPEGEAPSTEYWFDQEAVFLLQMHVLYGGMFRVAGSKHNGYYYPGIRIGRDKLVNADRYIGNLGPYQDARKVGGTDYHDHTRASVKPTSERSVAAQVGRKNERANLKAGKVTREGAIKASLGLWRESLLFPSRDQYSAALLYVYAVLDQRHPLLAPQAVSTTC
ncbi:hypothetical protein X739_07435 [Mesorhizobium sp. LNHC220B00]|nr:hypothetical protein [Mesorhizobium sp. LNHC220B00]ESY88058.1 hypothetical protein X739_07435 [Mesorhizobium sp. LNHC220B00]